jgi:hypothetical protein
VSFGNPNIIGGSGGSVHATPSGPARPLPAVDIVTVQNAPVILALTEASLFPDNAPNGVPIPAAMRHRTWGALAIIGIPGVTAVPANATVTIKIRTGTGPSDPEIGTDMSINPTNQVSPIGIGAVVFPVPATATNVFVGAFCSALGPVVQATGTEPISFILLALRP